MIYTITLNPAWDVTYRVHQILPEGLHRAYETRETAGGKGVNVARAVRHAGGSACAIACLGGLSGERIAATLETEGIDCISVGVEGDTRTNVSVIADDGRSFEVNGAGCVIDEGAQTRIRHALLENLLPGDTIALCGSFPRFRDGSPKRFWHSLSEIAAHTETSLVLDTGGAFLRELFAEKLPAPALIKPNWDELCDLASGAFSPRAGVPEGGADSAEAYCSLVEQCLRRSPVDLHRTAVLCTLGVRGAVYADASGSRYGATVPVRYPRAEKGAGDTYLGVFLTRRASGWGITEAMAAAASAAAAVVRGE